MHLVQTMAYTGERPWHGLGNKLNPHQPIEEWKKNAGMDWSIEASEVRYITGSNHVGVINAFRSWYGDGTVEGHENLRPGCLDHMLHL